MKKLTLLSLSLIAASQAFAHNSALPHTHEGTQTNWVPAIACLSALVFAGLAARHFYKSKSKRRS